MNGRDVFGDSGGTRFLGRHRPRSTASDRASVEAHVGAQGQWRLSAFYDDFSRFYTENAKTPFLGAGTYALTLPSNWSSGASSLQFAHLQQDLNPLALKTEWQTLGGDFLLKPWSGYEFKLHVEDRHRDGVKPQSLTFGPESNFPVGVFFPCSRWILHVSTNLTASFGFTSKRWQWTAAYTLSTFHDAQDSIDWFRIPLFPLARHGVARGGVRGLIRSPSANTSLPPDSAAHQFLLTSGFAFSPVTRLTARLSYSIQTQNVPFLPYTTNANLNVPMALPENSLHGLVDKTYGSIALTSHPLPQLDLTASYTYDDRDNKTPVALFSYVANDAQDQQTPAVPGVSRYIRYNIPHSFTFQEAKADVGYRPAPAIRLSLTYTGDFRWRDDQEVEDTTEHTLRAKALAAFPDGSAWVAYSYASRTGSIYEDDLPWSLSHTTAYLNASPADLSIEYPLLRKYNLADRRRQESKTGVTYNPVADLAVDLSGGYARDFYPHSLFGLRSQGSLLADADISYVLKEFTASVFYSFEQSRSDQDGYFIATTNLNNPAQDWASQDHDTVHSAGVKLDWEAIPQKLKLGANYTLSYGATAIGVQATPFAPPSAAVAPMPDARAITHTAGLKAEYTLTSRITLRAGYTLERHITDDWSYLGGLTPVAQFARVPRNIAPRYTCASGPALWRATGF